jgi:hypothetical protein
MAAPIAHPIWIMVGRLDRDDFGLIPSKIMKVIESKSLARDAGAKPVSAFPRPAQEAFRLGKSLFCT